MLGDNATFDVGGTARGVIDDHGNRLAFVELAKALWEKPAISTAIRNLAIIAHSSWSAIRRLRYASRLLRRSFWRSGAEPERLESRPVGFLVQELAQARVVGILAVGNPYRSAF